MSDPDSANQRLVVSSDRKGLACTLTILAGAADTIPDAFTVGATIEAHEITPSMIDRGAIEELVARAQSQPDSDHAALVAQGTPPKDGEHAKFELAAHLVEKFEEIQSRRDRLDAGEDIQNTQAKDAEGNAVDFRTQSAFVFVHEGDILGTVTDPIPGVEGCDVRGRVISPKQGRSLRLTLNESTTIIDGKLVARVNGVLKSTIDQIRVDSTLTIQGDVDFSTGNVDFPGSVLVEGGVKDLFELSATGVICIHKLVEAASLKSGGDLILNQGMAGRETGKIQVGGDLRAGYLDGITASVQGCCEILKEIKESDITVLGRVDSPACVFYGGRIDSHKRVDIGSIGSTGGVATAMSVGALPTIDDMILRFDMAIDKIGKQQNDGQLELLLNKTVKKLTATQINRVAELQFAQNRAREMEEKIAVAARGLLDVMESLGTPTIKIRQTLYKGVSIRLRHVEFMIKETVNGPVLIDLDPNGVPRCFLNGSTQPTPIKQIATFIGEAKADPVPLLTALAELGGTTGSSNAAA